MIKIGIDPGVNSGSLVVHESVHRSIWTIKRFDQTPYFEINELLKEIKAKAELNHDTIYCVIERQNPMPKQGISSTGKQMKHYGTLLGLLLANGIPYQDPVPRTWMKLYGMSRTASETKTQWKNRLKQKAKELEPQLNIVNNNADAILIARVAHKFFE
jgi:hypothetical protein